MTTPLRVLLVEDSGDDAALLLRELRRGGFEPDWERVEDAEALRVALDKGGWNLVLTDHRMPQFSGGEALAIVRERDVDLPILVVSGSIGEEDAVAAMRAGASDSLMKDRLTRLPAAVERELRESRVRSRVREYERWRRDLLLTISHEIRSPLTSIRSFVEILSGSPEDPAARKEFLGIIETETARLNELLEDLLFLASPSPPVGEIEVRPVSLADAFAKAKGLYDPEARERGIEVALALPRDLPPVLASREDLDQVLQRLLRTAGRVARPGERTEARASLLGAEVRCEISMEGFGVPASERERVFEPFGLDPESSSDLPKGSGLALPLCRRLLERMGARISIEEEAGARCMFVLAFPADTSPRKTGALRRPAPARRASPGP